MSARKYVVLVRPGRVTHKATELILRLDARMLRQQGKGGFSTNGRVFKLLTSAENVVAYPADGVVEVPERKRLDQEYWTKPELNTAPVAPSAGACEICGFSRLIEKCHIIPSRFGGPALPHNLLDLCPNHHTLFDRNLLTLEEVRQVWPKVYSLTRELPTNDIPELIQWRDEMYKRYGF